MKDLETLLRRYQEGDLDSEELDELNRLTHRDKVLNAANRQARIIRHRRYTAMAGVAAVLLVTGVIYFNHSSVDNSLSEMPVLAQADVPKPTEMVEHEMPEVPIQRESPTTMTVAKPDPSVHNQDSDIIQPKHRTDATMPVERQASMESVMEHHAPSVATDDPIVACNTQCSPDSVINDIWKFLRT